MFLGAVGCNRVNGYKEPDSRTFGFPDLRTSPSIGAAQQHSSRGTAHTAAMRHQRLLLSSADTTTAPTPRSPPTTPTPVAMPSNHSQTTLDAVASRQQSRHGSYQQPQLLTSGRASQIAREHTDQAFFDYLVLDRLHIDRRSAALRLWQTWQTPCQDALLQFGQYTVHFKAVNACGCRRYLLQALRLMRVRRHLQGVAITPPISSHL